MAGHNVCIIGGSGFVGGQVAGELVRRGHAVTVVTRRFGRHRDLLVLPTARVVEANPYDGTALARLLRGHDVVINLVGILNERGHRGHGFVRAHVELPRIITEACRQAGVNRYLHMSALGADAVNGPSHYLRSKGAGEALVHDLDWVNTTSFRPSVIFGPGDSFLNRFASLLRAIPFAFPLAGADSRFAPVYVGDVARAFVNAIDNKATFGRSYDLCGPREYTLQQLVEYTAAICGLKRRIIALPYPLGWLQAAAMEWLPGKPLSLDNFNSLKTPSVCRGPIVEELRLKATALETIAPRYLGGEDQAHRINALRQER